MIFFWILATKEFRGSEFRLDDSQIEELNEEYGNTWKVITVEEVPARGILGAALKVWIQATEKK